MYRSIKEKTNKIYKDLEELKNRSPLGRPKRIGGLPNIAAKRQHYEQQFKEQNGMCPICELPLSNNRRQRHHDHCHLSNRLRGVLCVSCNILLGNAKDDIKILQRAINYIEKHKIPRVISDDALSNEGEFKVQVHPSWNKPIEHWWNRLPDTIKFNE